MDSSFNQQETLNEQIKVLGQIKKKNCPKLMKTGLDYQRINPDQIIDAKSTRNSHFRLNSQRSTNEDSKDR